MSRSTTVCHLSDIPQGEGRSAVAAGRRIALFHLRGGQVFATQAECPHRQGPLADGLTGNGAVMCPLHDRLYDLRTGAGLNSDCRIAVYPVSVGEDGWIRVTAPAAVEPA